MFRNHQFWSRSYELWAIEIFRYDSIWALSSIKHNTGTLDQIRMMKTRAVAITDSTTTITAWNWHGSDRGRDIYTCMGCIYIYIYTTHRSPESLRRRFYCRSAFDRLRPTIVAVPYRPSVALVTRTNANVLRCDDGLIGRRRRRGLWYYFDCWTGVINAKRPCTPGGRDGRYTDTRIAKSDPYGYPRTYVWYAAVPCAGLGAAGSKDRYFGTCGRDDGPCGRYGIRAAVDVEGSRVGGVLCA